jgi:hypothetical protein
MAKVSNKKEEVIKKEKSASFGIRLMPRRLLCLIQLRFLY